MQKPMKNRQSQGNKEVIGCLLIGGINCLFFLIGGHGQITKGEINVCLLISGLEVSWTNHKGGNKCLSSYWWP